MNKFAYSLFIAMIASIGTLFLVQRLSPSPSLNADSQRIITLSELAQHNHIESCWKEIGGRIYDITAYIPNHPSSLEELIEWCGKPSTDAFTGITASHPHSAAATRMLTNMQVGVLEGASLAELPTEAIRATRSPSPQNAHNLTDGSYYAEGEPDQRGWFGVLEVTIYGGNIISAHYDEVQRNEDGAITQSKLRDYGYATRWRNVSGVSQLSAFPGYTNLLINTGSLDEIDAFTGATSSYIVFRALVEQILQEAATE